jgi:hypothetical protein
VAGWSRWRTLASPAGSSRPTPAVGDWRLSGADKTIVESKISSFMSCFLSSLKATSMRIAWFTDQPVQADQFFSRKNRSETDPNSGNKW